MTLMALAIIATCFLLAVADQLWREHRHRKPLDLLTPYEPEDIFAQLDRVAAAQKRQWAREKRRAIRGQR